MPMKMGHRRFCVGLREYPRKCMLILKNAAKNAGQVKNFKNYFIKQPFLYFCRQEYNQMMLTIPDGIVIEK